MRVTTLNAGELTDFSTAQEIPEKSGYWKTRFEEEFRERNM